MRLSNILLLATLLFGLGGCMMGPTNYEIFEMNVNWSFERNIFAFKGNKDFREIYSDDKYIYVFRRINGCVYGFFTNRDDKPEQALGWVILSGEENCIMQQSYSFLF
jgi:hypothetical protein